MVKATSTRVMMTMRTLPATEAQKSGIRLAVWALVVGLIAYGIEVGVMRMYIDGYTEGFAGIYVGIAAMTALSAMTPRFTALFLSLVAVPFWLVLTYMFFGLFWWPAHLPAFALLIAAILKSARST